MADSIGRVEIDAVVGFDGVQIKAAFDAAIKPYKFVIRGDVEIDKTDAAAEGKAAGKAAGAAYTKSERLEASKRITLRVKDHIKTKEMAKTLARDLSLIDAKTTQAIKAEATKRLTIRVKGHVAEQAAAQKWALAEAKYDADLTRNAKAEATKRLTIRVKGHVAEQAAAQKWALAEAKYDADLTRRTKIEQEKRITATHRAALAQHARLRKIAERPILINVVHNLERVNAAFSGFNNVVRRSMRVSLVSIAAWNASVIALTAGAAAAAIASFAQVELAAARAGAVFASDKFAESIAAGNGALENFAGVAEASSKRVIDASSAVARETLFNPSEVADGAKALAQAGFSEANALKELGTVARFAQNEQIDLAQATAELTGGLHATGLEADKLTSITDKFTRVANSTNATASEVAQAFSNQAAGAFRAYGQSVDEALTTIGLFAKANLRGAEAGTQTAILIREINRSATNKAPEVWKKYGLAIEDANGKAVPFSQTLTGLVELLEETRINKGPEAYQKLRKELDLTERSMRGLTIIQPQVAKMGLQGVERIRDSVAKSSGDTVRQSEVVTNTITFQYQNMIENIQIAFQSLGSRAKKPIIDLFNTIDNVVQSSIPSMQEMGDRLGDFIGSAERFFASDAFIQGSKNIQEAFAITLAGIRDAGNAFSDAFAGDNDPKSFFESFTEALIAFSQFSSAVLPEIAKGIGIFFRLIRDNQDTVIFFTKAALGVFAFSTAMKVLLVPVGRMIVSLSKMRKWLGAVSATKGLGSLTKIGASFSKMLGPIGIAIAVIEVGIGIIKGFSDEFKRASKGSGEFRNSLEEIKPIMEEVTRLGKIWFLTVMESVMLAGKIARTVGKQVAFVFTELVVLFGDAIRAIKALFAGDLLGAMKAFADAIVNTITIPFRIAISFIIESVADVIGALKHLPRAGKYVKKAEKALRDAGEATRDFRLNLSEAEDAAKSTGDVAKKSIDSAKDAIDKLNVSASQAFGRTGAEFLKPLAERNKRIQEFLASEEKFGDQQAYAVESATARIRAAVDNLIPPGRRNSQLEKFADDTVASFDDMFARTIISQRVATAKMQKRRLTVHDMLAPATDKETDAAIKIIGDKAVNRAKKTAKRIRIEALLSSKFAKKSYIQSLEFSSEIRDVIGGLGSNELIVAENEVRRKIGAEGVSILERRIRGVQGRADTLRRQIDNILRDSAGRARTAFEETQLHRLHRAAVDADRVVVNLKTQVESTTKTKMFTGALTSAQEVRVRIDAIRTRLRNGVITKQEAAAAFGIIADQASETGNKAGENAAQSAADSLAKGSPKIAASLKTAFEHGKQAERQGKSFGGRFKAGIDKALAGILSFASLLKEQANFMGRLKRVESTVLRLAKSSGAITGALKNVEKSIQDVTKKSVLSRVQLIATIIDTTYSAIKTKAAMIAPRIRSTGVMIVSNLIQGALSARPALIEAMNMVNRSVYDALGRIDDRSRASGVRVMSGLLAGMKLKFGDASAAPGTIAHYLHVEIPALIKQLKGPVAYDATILVPAGEAIMDGLERGLKGGFSTVESFLQRVGPSMEEFVPDSVFADATKQFMVDIAMGEKPDPDAFFKDLVPEQFGVGFSGPIDSSLAFLHKTMSLLDTQKMAAGLAQLFGLSVTSSDRAAGTLTSSGNVSDHTYGTAADISGSVSGMDKLADAIGPLYGSIFKQIIWNNRDVNRGFYVPDHLDHVHAAWEMASGFSKYSGKIGTPPVIDFPGASDIVDQAISIASKSTGVTPQLIAAIMKQESSFNPSAGSYAGAQGLMQLMPGTAASLGVSNPFDPFQNALGGAKYIKQMQGMFNNNLQLSLAAYNAGPGNVQSYGGIPPFRETQEYVRKVLENLRAFGGFREKGGPINPGKFYVAGERGPEFIAPTQRGTVFDAKTTAAMASMASGGFSSSVPQYTDNRTINIHTNATEEQAIRGIYDAHTGSMLGGVNIR